MHPLATTNRTTNILWPVSAISFFFLPSRASCSIGHDVFIIASSILPKYSSSMYFIATIFVQFNSFSRRHRFLLFDQSNLLLQPFLAFYRIHLFHLHSPPYHPSLPPMYLFLFTDQLYPFKLFFSSSVHHLTILLLSNTHLLLKSLHHEPIQSFLLPPSSQVNIHFAASSSDVFWLHSLTIFSLPLYLQFNIFHSDISQSFSFDSISSLNLSLCSQVLSLRSI